MYEKNFFYEEKKFVFKELSDEYCQKTAKLLNQEWPRSLCQRLLSLKSNIAEEKPKFPISLIILDIQNDQVIGHASCTAITIADDLTKNLVFIQSVLIEPTYRGKGLGKKLMLETEAYILEFSKIPQSGLMKTNCDYVYLNTKDKQTFYESLGYEKIEPILFYANKNTKCNIIMKNLLQSMSNDSKSQNLEKNGNFLQVNGSAPAPPPPPPPILSNKNNEELSTENVTWYRKKLV